MELKDTMQFVEKCFHEEPSACQCSCPFEFDIKAFLVKAGKGRWPAAYRDFSTAVLFPVAASKYCEQKCMNACRTALAGKEAVNIPAIEKACLSFTQSERPQVFSIPKKTQTIAVVGAGIAGLSCALTLARKKYSITVFEKESEIGGELRNDPDFPNIKADINRQFGTENVTYVFNTSPDESMLGLFDAVYIASGKDGEDFGLRESWNNKNYSCRKKGWFLGGALCGMNIPKSINAGRILSQYIEAYLQTGGLTLIAEKKDVSCTNHMIIHDKNLVRDPVIPEGDILSKDEAKAEALRCMQCICDYCLTGCELLKKYKKAPFKLAGEICGDANTTPPFSNCEATREVYSCNMCAYCENVCPEGVNIGDLFRYSREDRWKQDKWVPGIHDYWLRELDFNLSEGYYASEVKHEYVFFPGCQLGSILPDQAKAGFDFLKSRLDTGIILSCCGTPAVWAGDLKRRDSTRELITKALEQMGNPVVITACESCSGMLRELIPDIRIISLYEIINEKGFESNVLPFDDAALFSPCSAHNNEKLKNSICGILDKCGCSTQILDNKGKCCGFGGHIKLADKALYDEISTNRASESDKPYVVYCANCLDVFRQKGKKASHILEFVFGKTTEAIPTLEEKRSNALGLKEKIMKEDSKEFTRSMNEWDNLDISFSDKARSNMEDKLIRDKEVAEIIFKAEEENSFFEKDDGLRIACLEKDVLTYWVEYRTENSRFYVEYTYYHRMHIIRG